MGAPVSFQMVRHTAAPRVAGLICGMAGYRETVPGRFSQREAASLSVPLIVSLGTPFSIALGREPGQADRQPSFAAGLYPGPVHIQSDGRAECVQVDFTPLGAYRLFGGAVVDLAERMVDIADVLGSQGRRLHERLGATFGWQRRFELLEDFVAHHARYEPSREITFAYRRLGAAAGDIAITALAKEIGWSRQHLVRRFRKEIGLGPKSLARMIRFHEACRLARTGTAGNWAMIAAATGYADQAHLVREFAALAGEPPTAWATRMALTDHRLVRTERPFAGW